MTPPKPRNNSLWSIALGALAILVTLGLAVASDARSKIDTDARQDEKIKSIEQQVEWMRGDISEIKRDVKDILKEVRR